MLQLIDNPPPWPNGARCAVCFSFDMDVESLLHLYQRDAAPSRLATSSALRYGPFVSIPRLIDIFRHYGMKQTFFVPGWCIETYPDAIEALLKEGHEIGHHGWLHEKPNTLSADDEERVLDRALSPRRSGLDGLAKRLVAAKLGPVEHDPELDHPDPDERGTES